MGRRALSLVISLAVAFAMAEGGLRALTWVRGEEPPHPDRSVRREWRWALDHLAAGRAVIEDAQARFDPDLGWTVQPNLRLPGLTTNSAGMRGAAELTEARTDRPRLLFVGDSYTFGFGVEDDEAYPAVLGREHLPDWEVLNLGVPGYGPDQMLWMYEKVGRRYRPDVVVLGFFVRGYPRIFGHFRSYAKPWLELDDRGKLVLHGVPVPSPQQLYDAYASGRRRVGEGISSYVVASVQKSLEREEEKEPRDRDDPEWRLMAAILARFTEAVRADGATPILVIIPTRETGDADIHARVAALAKDEAERLGLAYVSLVDELAPRSESEVFRPDELGGHLSPGGNRLAAERIFLALQRDGLLDR